MNTWNQRNGQRSRVKQPGTREYKKNYDNCTNQFFAKRTRAGCLNCGSTEIVAKGGDGRLFVYCAKCNKQLKVINTKPTKVGNWSKTKIYRSRAGLCDGCGNGSFTGKLHLSTDCKKYELRMTCNHCGKVTRWHNV